MAVTFGMQPNIPSEANIPINTWTLLLVGETPVFWFVTLGDQRGRQFKLWKMRSLNVNPDTLPQIGQPIGLSISTQDAQLAGLLPPTTQSTFNGVNLGHNAMIGPGDLPPQVVALDTNPDEVAAAIEREADAPP